MKKLSKILVCLLVAVFAFGLFGCRKSNSNIVGVPASSDAVYGNGGLAVRKGNYLYFVNGYKSYEDMENKKDTYKIGALLVAKLDDNGKVQVDDNDVIKDEYYSYISNKLCGFEATDLYILDDYLYFTSPCLEDEAGTTEKATWAKNRAVFYRVKLDLSSKVEKLYQSSVASEKLEYKYYDVDNHHYLLVLEKGANLDNDSKSDVLYRVDVDAKKHDVSNVSENVNSCVMENASNESSYKDVFYTAKVDGKYELYRYDVKANSKVKYNTYSASTTVEFVGGTSVYVKVDKDVYRSSFNNGISSFNLLFSSDYMDGVYYAPDGNCALVVRGNQIQCYLYNSVTPQKFTTSNNERVEYLEDADASKITGIGFYNGCFVYYDSNKTVKSISYLKPISGGAVEAAETIADLKDVDMDNLDLDNEYLYYFAKIDENKLLHRVSLYNDHDVEVVAVYEVSESESEE